MPVADSPNVRDRTALVLAGGLGTRLRACVADRPKPLADVGGRPFLDALLDQLEAAGVERVVLCTGHLGDVVERTYGARRGRLSIVHSREDRPLGTAGALRHALRRLGEFAGGDADDHVLVLNGDSYCDVDVTAFTRAAAARRSPAALVAVNVADAARFGTVRCDRSGRVLAFDEKRGVMAPGLVNAGIYRFAVDLLAALPDRTPLSLERDVLPALAGDDLFAFRTDATFLDIGTPESYAAAATFLDGLARRHPDAPATGLLVLDRDGTLIAERHYLADPAGVELLPGVVAGLRRFRDSGYVLVVVTNQSGIARGYFDEVTLAAIHAELRAQLASAGITLHAIWHCPHHPSANCECRKPRPQLIDRALRETGVDPSRCLVVGDKACDIELGKRVGARTALVRTGYGRDTEREADCTPDVVVDGLDELALHELQEVGA